MLKTYQVEGIWIKQEYNVELKINPPIWIG